MESGQQWTAGCRVPAEFTQCWGGSAPSLLHEKGFLGGVEVLHQRGQHGKPRWVVPGGLGVPLAACQVLPGWHSVCSGDRAEGGSPSVTPWAQGSEPTAVLLCVSVCSCSFSVLG